jgi:hypothetical protein
MIVPRPKVVFAVVIYRITPAQSDTVRTLIDSLRFATGLAAKVLVLDNSPQPNAAFNLHNEFDYIAFERNVGLAHAYRRAGAFAVEHGAEFVVTLDQDSIISPAYLNSVRDYASRYSGKEIVFCPRILSGDRVVSPYVFGANGCPRFDGREGRLHAINSFSVYAVSLLTRENIIDDYYWLDGLDFAMYENLHHQHIPVVLMNIDVCHNLSVVAGGMNAQRLANMAHYETAFLFQYCGLARLCVGLLRLAARIVRVGFSDAGAPGIIGAFRALVTGALAGVCKRNHVRRS